MRSPLEVRAQRALEAAGYQVDYKVRPHRTAPGYPTDYFSAFDLIAYRPGELRWISINAASDGVRKAQRTAIAQLRFPAGCRREIWTYRSDRTVRKELVVDETGNFALLILEDDADDDVGTRRPAA